MLGVVLAAVTGLWFVPRIPQDPAYHEFADRRAFLGVPNFGDVVSNVAFWVVGALGLSKLALSKVAGLHPSYAVYCSAIIGVGAGSAAYHFDPSTTILVWDRLPMTVGFMAFFAMVIGDRISLTLGRRALWPLVIVGVGSVGYWDYTESVGAGDLRPYGLVQFLPILLVAFILCAYRSRYLRSVYLWGSIGLYGLAKVSEHWDSWVYEVSGVISGHTIKHILSAVGVWLVILALRRSQPT